MNMPAYWQFARKMSEHVAFQLGPSNPAMCAWSAFGKVPRCGLMNVDFYVGTDWRAVERERSLGESSIKGGVICKRCYRRFCIGWKGLKNTNIVQFNGLITTTRFEYQNRKSFNLSPRICWAGIPCITDIRNVSWPLVLINAPFPTPGQFSRPRIQPGLPVRSPNATNSQTHVS